MTPPFDQPSSLPPHLEPGLVLEGDLQDLHGRMPGKLFLERPYPVGQDAEARVSERQGHQRDLALGLREQRRELVRDPEQGLGVEGRELAGLVRREQLLVGLEELAFGPIHLSQLIEVPPLDLLLDFGNLFQSCRLLFRHFWRRGRLRVAIIGRARACRRRGARAAQAAAHMALGGEMDRKVSREPAPCPECRGGIPPEISFLPYLVMTLREGWGGWK